MRKDVFRIGELAGRIGVQPETIRYYERIGLLPKPERSRTGYRIYDSRHVECVDLIKRIQGLGFTLSEIREIIALKLSGNHCCQHVRDRLEDKLRLIGKQIERLRKFRTELGQSLKACNKSLKMHSPGETCPALAPRDSVSRIKVRQGPAGLRIL